MKLKLPNDEEIILNLDLSYEEKLKIVTEIIKKHRDYFLKHWETNKVKVCLDILGNYLCHRKNIHDKKVLSRKKMSEMVRGNSKYIPFSSLPQDQQKLLGILEYVDENELDNYRNLI